jgi:SAM-dependent methyltransferase
MKTYDKIGNTYVVERCPDPRIEEKIHQKISRARSVLNIGAGTGSYEPKDKAVVSLDPSILMLRKRPPGSAPCVLGEAEKLPFKNSTFDCAMALLTIHHWSDWKNGISEALRVSRSHVVILTWDPNHEGFWLTQDYLQDIAKADSEKFPSMAALESMFRDILVESIMIPSDCTDGFMGAYWQRPDAYLDHSKRASISSLALNPNFAGLEKLRREISSGEWEKKYGHLRNQSELDVGYRLLVIGKK